MIPTLVLMIAIFSAQATKHTICIPNDAPGCDYTSTSPIAHVTKTTTYLPKERPLHPQGAATTFNVTLENNREIQVNGHYSVSRYGPLAPYYYTVLLKKNNVSVRRTPEGFITTPGFVAFTMPQDQTKQIFKTCNNFYNKHGEEKAPKACCVLQ